MKGSIPMNIDPTHIAFRCGTEDPRGVVNDLEAALADAKARRDKILVDIGKANDAAFAGDRRARLELSGLNKQDADAGRLVLSIEKQLGEARKHVKMAQAQAEAARAKSQRRPFGPRTFRRGPG
jgi:hypothetical protein